MEDFRSYKIYLSSLRAHLNYRRSLALKPTFEERDFPDNPDHVSTCTSRIGR